MDGIIQALNSIAQALWPPTPDVWHEVGAAGEPAFTNSWVNFATGFNTAAFTKDTSGFVHLKGLIKSGTLGTTAFTLPVGYRPSARLMCWCASNNGSYISARVDILADGTVFVTTPQAGNSFLSLDNITFKAEG